MAKRRTCKQSGRMRRTSHRRRIRTTRGSSVRRKRRRNRTNRRSRAKTRRTRTQRMRGGMEAAAAAAPVEYTGRLHIIVDNQNLFMSSPGLRVKESPTDTEGVFESEGQKQEHIRRHIIITCFPGILVDDVSKVCVHYVNQRGTKATGVMAKYMPVNTFIHQPGSIPNERRPGELLRGCTIDCGPANMPTPDNHPRHACQSEDDLYLLWLHAYLSTNSDNNIRVVTRDNFTAEYYMYYHCMKQNQQPFTLNAIANYGCGQGTWSHPPHISKKDGKTRWDYGGLRGISGGDTGNLITVDTRTAVAPFAKSLLGLVNMGSGDPCPGDSKSRIGALRNTQVVPIPGIPPPPTPAETLTKRVLELYPANKDTEENLYRLFNMLMKKHNFGIPQIYNLWLTKSAILKESYGPADYEKICGALETLSRSESDAAAPAAAAQREIPDTFLQSFMESKNVRNPHFLEAVSPRESADATPLPGAVERTLLIEQQYFTDTIGEDALRKIATEIQHSGSYTDDAILRLIVKEQVKKINAAHNSHNSDYIDLGLDSNHDMLNHIVDEIMKSPESYLKQTNDDNIHSLIVSALEYDE